MLNDKQLPIARLRREVYRLNFTRFRWVDWRRKRTREGGGNVVVSDMSILSLSLSQCELTARDDDEENDRDFINAAH